MCLVCSFLCLLLCSDNCIYEFLSDCYRVKQTSCADVFTPDTRQLRRLHSVDSIQYSDPRLGDTTAPRQLTMINLEQVKTQRKHKSGPFCVARSTIEEGWMWHDMFLHCMEKHG